MNPKDHFIYKYGNESFPHAMELRAALDSEQCTVSAAEGVQQCSHLERIYRIRAEHVRSHSEMKVRALYPDCVHLYEVLSETPNESCRIWNFKFEGQHFAAFEVVESNKVAGCFHFGKEQSAMIDAS